MANNIGTLVGAPIRPFAPESVFAAAFADELQGGVHIVAKDASRNAMPSWYLQNGMIVVVLDSTEGGNAKVTYQYDSAADPSWEVFNSGSGGSGDVAWNSGNVGLNNQLLTANGDGSINAESTLLWNGNQMAVGTTEYSAGNRTVCVSGGVDVISGPVRVNLDSPLYISSNPAVSDTSLRVKIFAASATNDAYFDYYKNLHFRSGELNSQDKVVITSDGDVSISGDLYVHGIDSSTSANVVYVNTEGKLTYGAAPSGVSYLRSLLDVSIGSDVSAGYVIVYDPSASDTSIWKAVKPIEALGIFALDSSILWKLDASLIMPKNIDHDVQLNSIQIETDAGAVSIMDMAITSTPVSGTEESYSFNLDGEPYLTLYSEATGTTNPMRKQVKSEVPLIVKSTEYIGIGDPCTNGSWRFVISGANLSIQKLVANVWVEKTLIV